MYNLLPSNFLDCLLHVVQSCHYVHHHRQLCIYDTSPAAWVGKGVWVSPTVTLTHTSHVVTLETSGLTTACVILQVHIYCYLHLWVPRQNLGSRFLHRQVHLPERSVELAGFQCYRHGVSRCYQIWGLVFGFCSYCLFETLSVDMVNGPLGRNFHTGLFLR